MFTDRTHDTRPWSRLVEILPTLLLGRSSLAQAGWRDVVGGQGRVWASAVSLWLTMVAVACADDPPPFDALVHPVLERYCVTCHNATKKSGELDLSPFRTEAQALANVAMWESVASRIASREMPPEGSPQLSSEDRAAIVNWFSSLPKPAETCQELATDETQHFFRGYVMSRRITRAEYRNSLRDLFGARDPAIAEWLPADGSGGEGFDTVGDTLFTSEILLEAYLKVADRILDRILPAEAEAIARLNSADQRSRVILLGDAAESRHASITVGEPQTSHWAHSVATDLSVADIQERISRLARRAYRRPVDEADLAPLMQLANDVLARGESAEAALRLAFKAILISPHFLFLAEPEPHKGGVYALSSYPLAARLAAFLWSSIPDEQLLFLASTNQLQDIEVLRAQVQRMLADPRSRALGENFAMQWLELSGLGVTQRPDPSRFPEVSDALLADMRHETSEFVAYIFRKNQSLTELISADYGFVNQRLATLYDLPDIVGDELRLVQFVDGRRGGLVTQASVLTVTSYPLRTSPVLRGKWLLGELMGQSVPPPPPNVPALDQSVPEQAATTLRARLEQHRANPECAACHAKMDPLGFGLENYDAIGRYRESDAGQPIDSSGTLPGGEQFRGAGELKQLLLARRDNVIKHLARKLLGYALGRELNKFDQCVVDRAMNSLAMHDHRSHVLVEEIVLSYPFRHRYAKKE